MTSSHAEGHAAAVDVLAERGAVLEPPHSPGSLHIAAAAGHLGVVNVLLKHGAELERADTGSGSTALCAAADAGHLAVVAVLAEAGGCVDGPYASAAAAQEDAEEGAAQHRKHARAVGWGMPPVYTAAQSGDLPLLNMLLKHGANVDATTAFGQSAVFAAAENGWTDAVSVLARAGADCDAARPDIGWTPLHGAAAAGYTDTVIALITEGAKHLDARTDGGETPLLIAAEEGHTDCCVALAAFGADRTAKDTVGRTPRAAAADADADDVLRWLCAVEGWSAIEIAAGAGLHTIAAWMLKTGRADPSADAPSASALISLARGKFLPPPRPPVHSNGGDANGAGAAGADHEGNGGAGGNGVVVAGDVAGVNAGGGLGAEAGEDEDQDGAGAADGNNEHDANAPPAAAEGVDPAVDGAEEHGDNDDAEAGEEEEEAVAPPPPAPPHQVAAACPLTVAVMKLAVRPFSNRNAQYYSDAYRKRVHTLFLIGERVWQQHYHPEKAGERAGRGARLAAKAPTTDAVAVGAVVPVAAATTLPSLPRELWAYILVFISRRDWCGDAANTAPAPPSPTPALVALDEYLLLHQ